MVACPLCEHLFTAEPDVPAPPPPAPPRPSRPVSPVAPPTPEIVGRPQPRRRAEPVSPPASYVVAKAETVEHHPHDMGGGLPATVLVGLALLPFLIPLLWILGPAVAGQDPTLSLAAPTALAIAASALCLAVVYTVDWTPTTRVKGVLILVGLSYFTAVSLFYLKKDMLDRVKRFFGAEAEWKEFRAPRGDFRVKLPGRVRQHKLPLLPGWTLDSHQGSHNSFIGVYSYNVGYSKDLHAELPDAAWFDAVKQAMQQADMRQKIVGEREIKYQQRWPGREWVVEYTEDDEGTVSIIRVYRIQNRLYYLSARGPKLDNDDEETKAFFDSFHVSIPEPKE